MINLRGKDQNSETGKFTERGHMVKRLIVKSVRFRLVNQTERLLSYELCEEVDGEF